MYVIFPAEEVVYLTYGYRVIPYSALSPEQRQHLIRTSGTPPGATPAPSTPVLTPNGYDTPPPPKPKPPDEVRKTAQRNSDDTSRSLSSITSSKKNAESTSGRVSPVVSNKSKKSDDDRRFSVKPKRKTSKEQTSDHDFFERAKTRYRLSTCELQLNVPTELQHTLAKSAPSTPLETRRVFKSFETERHISTTNLRVSRERTPLKGLLSPGYPFVKDRSPNKDGHGDRDASPTPFNTTPDKSPTKKISFFSTTKNKGRESGGGLWSAETSPSSELSASVCKMAATSNNEATLRELTHPAFNEHLKAHNGVTFKLVKTVSDFTQHLSQIYEQHAEQLQLLVENFRKRNGELRKERPACPSSLFHTWETLLQEVEIDSQNHSDIASILGRQVSRPLLERSFHRKIQSRKVFTHRESYETIISKTEEKLAKCRQDYKNAYLSYLSAPTTQSLSAYFNTHNAYVQQLHATNGMLEEYKNQTLPNLLQELEEIYSDLCTSVAEAVLQGAEVVSQRAVDQSRRYEGLSTQCRAVGGPTDLAHFVRSLPQPVHNRPVMRRLFSPPQLPQHTENSPEGVDGEKFEQYNEQNIPPPLKDELVVDRLADVQIKPSHDALRKEAADLEIQIKQIQDALDTLTRMQQRSLESNLFNKVNELQEDISIKRFDLRVAQIHLSAIVAQKELFSNKMDTNEPGRDRKMSASSQGSMKSKWLKAFKSLKTPPSGPSPKEIEKEKKNGGASGRGMVESDVHNFQEYTYKKITPCDVCSQVLRGHTRQGLKCRVCKMNVHVDCQDKATKCQVKSRLLRRQKSTSEIDTRIPEPTVEDEKSTEVDLIYQVLKQATDLSNNPKGVGVVSASVTGAGALPPNVIVPERTANVGSGSSGSSSGQSLNRRAGIGTGGSRMPPAGVASNLTVTNPVPYSTSSGGGGRPLSGPTPGDGTSMRRRLFAGMKSLTGFGSRSRRGSPNSRSISLPESGGMRTSSSALMLNPGAGDVSTIAPHSPRRQKLNLRMKSLSLDSPESTEHVQRRRHGGVPGVGNVMPMNEQYSNQSSSSRLHSPSSPVHNRRLLSARNMRMSSVELPDDNEKSLSSASTSPCPSPVGGKKAHRLLPTNLYVILYNYKSRQSDELDLKAGYKVTVIDTSDNDWWKGKCLGKVGYFPSKYCTKLSAGEKPLQVTQNLRVSGGENNEGLLLLRDQIVIQVADEIEGMIRVRNGNSQTGCCPAKFLQEV